MTRKSCSFTVEGVFRFPLDMLRYDACYPYSTEDATKISETFNTEIPSQRRVIHLHSNINPPTAARWKSFGWTVIAQGR